jgi:hypothetical protein
VAVKLGPRSTQPAQCLVSGSGERGLDEDSSRGRSVFKEPTHDVSTGQSRFQEHNGPPRRGLLGGTSGWRPSTGGLGRSGDPVAGSPTHPAMPNLIVLWKMSPLWGEGRGGAGLRAQGPVHRNQGTTGPKSKPEAAGGWWRPRSGARADAAAGLSARLTVVDRI